MSRRDRDGKRRGAEETSVRDKEKQRKKSGYMMNSTDEKRSCLVFG
jgi:hypothetical protein